MSRNAHSTQIMHHAHMFPSDDSDESRLYIDTDYETDSAEANVRLQTSFSINKGCKSKKKTRKTSSANAPAAQLMGRTSLIQ